MKEFNTPLTREKSPFFFAASNSKRGFVSYFPQVFSPADYDTQIIIKGGPGTGKSSLMKAIRNKSTELGYESEAVLCSSDPSSYDGVIIDSGEKKLALLDGTSPHTSDPTLPGACEYIIDLGTYLNRKYLRAKRDIIDDLVKKKAENYKCAYAALKAAGSCSDCKKSLLEECIDRKKLCAYVGRLLSKSKWKTKETSIRYKLKNAISSDGIVSSPIYENENGIHFVVVGTHGAEFAFFDALIKSVKDNGCTVNLSPSPLSPETYDALSLPDEKTYFYRANRGEYKNEHKIINTERFLSDYRLKQIKPKLRSLSRDQAILTATAVKFLSEAKKLHLKLEEIYSSAMDFHAKEEMQSKLLAEIFYQNRS